MESNDNKLSNSLNNKLNLLNENELLYKKLDINSSDNSFNNAIKKLDSLNRYEFSKDDDYD